MPSEINPARESANSIHLLWLRTRDGSPTLWSNELGESYRSLRGAFTESYWAFVRPALVHAQALKEKGISRFQIAEFGLGLGTNWLLWTHLAQHFGIEFNYVAIEKDPKAFAMGLQRWIEDEQTIVDHFAKLAIQVKPLGSLLRQEADRIQIVSSPEALLSLGQKFHCWFHDPFGAEVNPEGYTLDTLRLCSRNWDAQILGISYACNRVFQDSLKSLGMEVRVVDFEEPIGKRSRLEFRKLPDQALQSGREP